MKLTRRLVQLGFLLLTLMGVFVVRGHAERWCPFGGLEAAYDYTRQGNLICSLGVSNFYVLAGLLVLSLLARRVFCGYACPIGTISEWLHIGARRLMRTAFRAAGEPAAAVWHVRHRVDRVLAGELVLRGFDPCYALLSRHGTDITVWAYALSGAIALASLFIMLPFCRWLCPLAAVLNPCARFGLLRIRRESAACADCGACARACPMGIRVDQVRQVTAARCTSCLDCLTACPKHADGAIGWGLPRRGMSGSPATRGSSTGRLTRMSSALRSPVLIIVFLLLACIGGAVGATYAFPLPSFVHTRGEVLSRAASVRLRIVGANCRHSCEQLAGYLLRDDDFEVRGYLRIEAWPDPAAGDVRITFDPGLTNEAALKRAITEPRYDRTTKRWRPSPFTVAGYDPLANDP